MLPTSLPQLLTTVTHAHQHVLQRPELLLLISTGREREKGMKVTITPIASTCILHVYTCLIAKMTINLQKCNMSVKMRSVCDLEEGDCIHTLYNMHVHMYMDVHVQVHSTPAREGSENRKEKTPNNPTQTHNPATTKHVHVHV